MSDACPGFSPGRTKCWECHPEGSPWNGEPRISADSRRYEWSLRRNPAYWGSTAPEVLVLGFSKGPEQQGAVDDHVAGRKKFEQVPFASDDGSMRRRLRDMLATLDLWRPGGAPFDKVFNSGTGRFGFASLVRCSIAMKAPGSKEYVGSGKDILANATASGEDFVGKCVDRHLRTLPGSVKLVLMLGIGKDYVHACHGMIGGTPLPGPDVPYAYDARGVRFAHIPHPSGSNTSRAMTFCFQKNPGKNDDCALDCRPLAVEQVLRCGLGNPEVRDARGKKGKASLPTPQPTARIIKANDLPPRIRQRFISGP